jgi:acetyl-CoA acetyltransferase family protein
MKIQDDDVLIIEGARTAVGSFLGSLCDVSATELGAIAAKGAIERAKISPEAIDNIYFGNVIQSSKDSAYIARHVGLKAGVPVATPALTLNRACASGLDAIIEAGKSLRCGDASYALAGGAENMSMTPYAMRGVRRGWKMIKSDVDDMLFSALHDPMAGCSIGETVEHLAGELGIGREAADAAAVWSQERARAAQSSGALAEEIVPVVQTKRRKETIFDSDENLRPETSLEALACLPGLFGKEGIVTAGNSSGLNDAGAAVVMTTGAQAASAKIEPLGRLLSWAAVGVEPRRMGEGPIEATRKALSRAKLSLSDIDLFEINDSFTVQYIAVENALGLDRDRVNRNGGAIAIGHPMGATGTRLALSALYQLRRRGGGRALCTLCVGGGQGVAAIFEA